MRGPGVVVSVDKYNLPDSTGAGYSTTAGRVGASSSITGGEKTGLIFAAGQSRISNQPTTTPYTPTNTTKVHQINIYDGLVYQMIDPVLGAGGSSGSYLSKLGDALINAGVFQRVIFVPMGIAGTATTQWITGDLRQRILVAGRRARALGYGAPNADLYKAIIWENGQTDVANGVSSAQYQANIITIQGLFAEVGFAVPFFIAQSTMDTNATNSTIRAAQAALVNNSALRYAGPDLDTLTGGTNLQADGTHFNDTGNTSAATLWKTALDVVF